MKRTGQNLDCNGFKGGPPCYGIIANNGAYFTLMYERTEQVNNCSRQGYDISVFEEAGDNTPIVDWRKADSNKAFQFALHTDSPIEVVNYNYGKPGPTLQEYIAKAREYGATITTAKEILSQVN